MSLDGVNSNITPQSVKWIPSSGVIDVAGYIPVKPNIPLPKSLQTDIEFFTTLAKVLEPKNDNSPEIKTISPGVSAVT
ncbi:hypothetical protein A3J90_03060 [candidate division WOR-1 bacterium RIFOXYC2_FULL_37_10]|uniref:Uncharacterized protein n=1 Tax=candidate division WOR-1 bacterium RIFOXYB2_FULL_37_13 TaxID=1802579 RepID=A0A1F4SVH3_UNCSA|nr:MAG: hypothetical protein A2246_01025 [candidate division WOR-1 bacterium RIFOXYA2_FULL_37_7]OGC24420.1 MAG: hypothetical protein A2310_08430 [candidate division WOR-1 bacterium RIFOXYB2_FULL_37_13]OGC37447.1 MAG: hypothetical protein A3J90_03060 [candidate division WOR-1 bacterium RIFOXYC2_FULL_37_10]